MLNAILEELNNGLDRFLNLYDRYLRQADISEESSFPRNDSARIFRFLVTSLTPEGSENFQITQIYPLPLSPDETTFFNDLSKAQKKRGVSGDVSIACLKAIQQAVEDQIEDMVATDSNKLKALRLLRRKADRIELSFITEEQNTDQNLVVADLGKTILRLTQKKNIYESIFEATSNLVLVTNSDGMIQEINPEAKVFFSGQSIIGRYFGEVFRLPGQPLEELLQRLPPNRPHEVTLTSGHFSKVFNLHIKPLGKTIQHSHIILILSDITCMVDHRRALEQSVAERTQALENSKKMLDAIFRSVGKGIVLLDHEREIVKANQKASEIFGIPLEVLVGTSFCTLTDNIGCREMDESMTNLIEGQRRNFEVTCRYVDGKTFPSEIVMTRMDLNGQVFWPVIVRDISEQRALENRLWQEKLQTEEMNVTLKNVLKTIEGDRRETEQKLADRVRSSLLPGIEKIRKETNPSVQSGYLDLLREQLVSLTAGTEAELDADLLKLSKTELKICRFVKAGLSGKEICDAMNLSFETVQTHRKNIRKKLGLSGKNVNLHTFLANRNCKLGGLEGDN